MGLCLVCSFGFFRLVRWCFGVHIYTHLLESSLSSRLSLCGYRGVVQGCFKTSSDTLWVLLFYSTKDLARSPVANWLATYQRLPLEKDWGLWGEDWVGDCLYALNVIQIQIEWNSTCLIMTVFPLSLQPEWPKHDPIIGCCCSKLVQSTIYNSNLCDFER